MHVKKEERKKIDNNDKKIYFLCNLIDRGGNTRESI
jgi:hypothetical protein